MPFASDVAKTGQTSVAAKPSQRRDKMAERENQREEGAEGITPEFRKFVAKKLDEKLQR